MAIDLTNLTSSTSFSDIAKYSNASTNGVLFIGFILVLWLVLFLAFYKHGTFRAMTAASWISTVVSIFLYMAGLVSMYVFIVVLLIGAFAAFMTTREQ